MKKVLFSESQIKEMVQKLGKELTEYYKNDELPPVFIGVMKGALPFMMDLIRSVDCHILLDFAQLSSYEGTESTGIITLKRDISTDLRGRRVLVIEDIIDSGYTLKWFKEYLIKNYHPSEIKLCALLDKKCKRKTNIDVDFKCCEIGDMFIAGYGLDYKELLRNDKEIFVMSKEDIEEIDAIVTKK